MNHASQRQYRQQTSRRDFLYRSGIMATGLLGTTALSADTSSRQQSTASRVSWKMKLALMTYTFARQGWKKDGRFDLAGMCRVGRGLGIDGVDIVSHSFSPLDPALIRKTVEDHGQKVVCYTCFPKLNKPTPEQRAPGIEEVKKAVEIAKILGTDKIMIHTPGDHGTSADECRSNWIHGLQEALPLARAAGLSVCIESIMGSPLAKSREMLQAVRTVPGLKLVFDQGNVFGSGEEPLLFLGACKDHVVHVHFKDGRWREETTKEGKRTRHYSNELIGEGAIDHAAILRAMRDAGYAGHIDIEYEGDRYTPDIAMRRASEYLNHIVNSLE